MKTLGKVRFTIYLLGFLGAAFFTALLVRQGLMSAAAAVVAFHFVPIFGVQESGYLVFGNVLGITGETVLAISLIARMRDRAVGIPGLIAWQWIEARRLWWRRSIPIDGEPSPESFADLHDPGALTAILVRDRIISMSRTFP